LINQSKIELNDKKRRLKDHAIATCLANLLRITSQTKHFLKSGGMSLLSTMMKTNSEDIQTTYYIFVVLWLISFENISIQYFCDPQVAAIKNMIMCIQKLSREKIIRVGYSTFKNLSESDQAIELMVEGGLLKVTDILAKSLIKEEEVKKDIEVIGAILEKNLKILTSFEKYQKELNNGILEWGPIHSERFWKENFKKMEDNNFLLIEKLVRVLHTENLEYKLKNQAIACFDLGEFCRNHPFGKKILDKYDCKNKIMELIKSPDSDVKENATVAIQKMLLNNWQAVDEPQK